jgi:hypothetical protein
LGALAASEPICYCEICSNRRGKAMLKKHKTLLREHVSFFMLAHMWAQRELWKDAEKRIESRSVH